MILHKLTVGQTVILDVQEVTTPSGIVETRNMAEAYRVMLGEFRRDYDEAATLEFTLFRPWNEVAFQADQLVTLKLTDTDTGESRIVFSGLLDPVRPIASVHQGPAQQYTARDHSHALRQPQALHSNGRQGIHLKPGSVESVVTEYLEHVGGELSRVGVAVDALYCDGADAVEGWPVSLSAESIDEGFRKIASSAPGVAVFLDPNEGVPTYRFVRLFAAPRRTITLDATRVEEASVAQSVVGCCGAVEIAQRTVIGEYTETKMREMWKAWDTELNDQWTLPHAGSSPDEETGQEDELAKVYRLWSFAHFKDEVQGAKGLVARTAHATADGAVRWVDIPIKQVDFAASTVLLAFPAVRTFGSGKSYHQNLMIPGNARLTPVRLQFSSDGQSPITTESVRVPELDFAGRAVAIAPTTCGYCKQIEVPAGVGAEAYAQASFEALSEPRASGSVPIVGRLDLDLFFLACRACFNTASHGATGAEDLDAPVTAVVVSFENGGAATVSFNRDVSKLLEPGGA